MAVLLNGIITRGLSTDTNTLLTRGFHLVSVRVEISEGGPGRKRRRVRALAFEALVFGDKVRQTKEEVDLLGSVVFPISKTFDVVYAILVNQEFLVIGSKARLTSLQKIMRGEKVQEIREEALAFGQKEHFAILQQYCTGSKQIPVSQLVKVCGIKSNPVVSVDRILTGTKQITSDINVLLQGSHQVDLVQDYPVTGKRNIIPILIALNDIDCEEEDVE